MTDCDGVPSDVVETYGAAMSLALTEARAALDHDDVPVGAVVLLDGEVIAARHNERELRTDPVAHAEILALQDAARHVGSWRLDECTMVVTLEPCAMCAGAMVNARLGRVVYGAADPKAGAATSHYRLLDGTVLNHEVDVIAGVGSVECGDLLRSFFRARRSGSHPGASPPQDEAEHPSKEAGLAPGRHDPWR